MHGGRKNIFADAFDDVGFRLADFAGLHEFVIERADRINADNFHGGIFFFQEFAGAADGASGAHGADEVRDFSGGVFPNLRASGAVVGVGIHGIFVLIGIKRIGNLACEFFGDGIVAARVVGLDGGGADDDFSAEGFEQIDFFAGLLVGDSENDFVAADGSDEREAHAGVSGSAFDDGAAGLEQAFALGFVDHPDADAVFHGAARIEIIGFHEDFGLNILGNAIEADERRVADGLENIFAEHAEAATSNWARSKVTEFGRGSPARRV